MNGTILVEARRQLARVEADLVDDEFSGRVVELTNDVDLVALFSQFENAVNDILLVEVDRIEREIAALKPTFKTEEGDEFLIVNLQLYPDLMSVSFSR